MNKYQIMIANESNPYNVRTRSIFVAAKDASDAEKIAKTKLNKDEEIIDVELTSGSPDKRVLGKMR